MERFTALRLKVGRSALSVAFLAAGKMACDCGKALKKVTGEVKKLRQVAGEISKILADLNHALAQELEATRDRVVKES